MLDWFLPTGRPVHCLLTKSDKISHGAAIERLREVRAELTKLSSDYSAQLFSSLKKIGVPEAEAVLAGWLAPAGAQSPDGDVPI